ANRTDRHAGIRPGLGHRRAGRCGVVTVGQRGAGPGPRLSGGLLHGGGAGRGWATGRNRGRRAGPGHHQQVSGTLGRRCHGKDHHTGACRVVRSKASARAVRAARQERGMTQAYTHNLASQFVSDKRLFSLTAWASLVAAVALLATLPLLNLVVSPDHPLYVTPYAVALLGKFMCYALAALALDLVWGYAGILSLGHGLFFALGGY